MRTPTLVLVCALSAAIVAIVVALLWSLGSASGERDRFSSLEIAPRDADIFVAINTDPTSPQWLAVNDSLDQVNAKDPIRRAVDEALAEVNLDWEKDILPIAGDEGFFSVPEVSQVDGERGYVAAFRVRDTGKAQEVFDSLRERFEQEGQAYETEEYDGVTIYHTVEPDFDGDPATESDCEVDDEGTILCDGDAPIPEEPHLECVVAAIDLGDEDLAPDECQAFFTCQDYAGLQAESDPADTDGDGRTDACEAADQMKREWEENVEQAEPYQDCAGLEDAGDYQCEDVSTAVTSISGAVAVFADVVVVGASPEDVKAVVDVVQGRAPSAVENERLQEFREAQKEDFLTWGYADLAPVWDMAEASLPTGFDSDGSSVSEVEPEPADDFALPEPDTGYTVTSFDADYRVENGALHVTERIVVDFGQTARQRFFRYIPNVVTYDFLNDIVVGIEPLSVNRNGVPEEFSVHGFPSHTRIQTEEFFPTIAGQHAYEIEYLVRGAIVNVEDERFPYYDIAWNVTGDNWGVPIGQATATFTIPEGADLASIYCFVGTDPLPGLQMGCSSTQEGIPTFHFAARAPIEPGSSMALFVNVAGDSGVPDVELVPNDDFAIDEVPEQEFPFDVNTEDLIAEARGTYDRVGFSVSATGDGFAVDLTVLHAPDFEPKYAAEPTKVFDSHFADAVPADTIFFFAGYDFYGQNWQPLRDYLDTDSPDGMTLNDFLGDFTAETGLDLEEDILALMTGEYAVAGDITNFDAETPEYKVLAMLDVADAAKAQQSLDDLGEYLEGEGAVEVSREPGWQRWSIPDSDANAVGIAVEGRTVIGGYPDSAAGDAVAGFNDSLAATADWKATMGALPTDTTSIGFVSISRILEEIRAMPDSGTLFEEATDGEMTLDDLAAVRSVGFATTSRENGFGLHFVLLMDNR